MIRLVWFCGNLTIAQVEDEIAGWERDLNAECISIYYRDSERPNFSRFGGAFRLKGEPMSIEQLFYGGPYREALKQLVREVLDEKEKEKKHEDEKVTCDGSCHLPYGPYLHL